MAVSTDDLSGAEQSVARFGVEFPILYTSRDPAVPESYEVFNLFGDGLASASVWLIDADGVIRWKSVGKNYQHQISSEEIIEQLGRL